MENTMQYTLNSLKVDHESALKIEHNKFNEICERLNKK
jgi:hypothetical protein